MMVGDPQGYNIIKEFFGENWRYNVELPSDFIGEFSLAYIPELSYTNRSRYLKNIIINGSNDVNIIGNELSNLYWVIME